VRLVLNDAQPRQYRLVLKQLDREGYHVTIQNADVYLVNSIGFHLFYTRGRLVRAIAGWCVVEVKEIEQS